MRIVAITYAAPYGRGELFVTRELAGLAKRYPNLQIIPLTPASEMFHEIGRPLIEKTIILPLWSLRILTHFLYYALRHPKPVGRLAAELLRESKTIGLALRNFAVLPKSVYVASMLERSEIDHLYVNWATTPATMALIISRLTSIPWSLRAHRWDIYEDNMLRAKVGGAAFVVCVSEQTRRAVLQRAGEGFREKVFTRAPGVTIPVLPRNTAEKGYDFTAGAPFQIVTPANLVPVKGHEYLIKACGLLSRDHYKFRVRLFGDGPLRGRLMRMILSLGLSDTVEILEPLPNDQLLSLYGQRSVDAVVLPSIVTDDGQHEGLPTVLVEAMSFAIPVIATSTGGIPELLRGDAGVLVEEKSERALADAVARLMTDRRYAAEVAQRGRLRIETEYDLTHTVEWLGAKFERNQRLPGNGA